MATAAIVGASGYTGQETLDRVLAHPGLELYALGSDTLAGRSADALDPRLGRNGWRRIPRFITNDAALSCGADVVFLCLAHEEAATVAPPSRGVVIDLSGAHRFRDPAIYESWYGFEHPAPALLASWSYGLPEVRPPVGRLVANPGCYATAALLALAPIGDLIERDAVVVDALSGMTGAGRSLKSASHAGVVLENVAPYDVGTHRHAPEIASILGFPVAFVPHLSLSGVDWSPRATCALAAPSFTKLSRSTTRAATSSPCYRGGSYPSSLACSTPTAPRSESSRTG